MFLLAYKAYTLLYVLVVGSQNTIRYTVENRISNNDLEFQESMLLEPSDRVFIDIMEEAAALDDTFRYRTIDYGEPLGEYVYEINGLPESPADQTYWALLLRPAEGQECLVQSGVSYYQPQIDEHVVFSYMTYDMTAELPAC